MSHPILIAALVEDRHCRCPCGAVSHHPDGLCRECQATVVRRRRITEQQLAEFIASLDKAV
jgi:hypothetical protein